MNEFIKNLQKELINQNNRCTANPLFCVQQKKRIYGIDHQWDPDTVWVAEDDYDYQFETDDDLIQFLKENEIVFDEEELRENSECSGFIKLGYIDKWEFVNVHLTEKAAQRYIDENKHNLTEPRIYVTSQYRCHEFNQVVEWIKCQI